MAFFLSGVRYEGVMVVGTRKGATKAGKPFVALTVADSDGNANTFSTTDPDCMQKLEALQQGDSVDLKLVVAGGPQKQYAMISREPDSVMPHVDGVGY